MLIKANDIISLFESKELMYHGTSSKFLDSIIKNGLLFKEDGRVWGTKQVSTHLNDLESYHGTYFTLNFMTAYSASGQAHRKFGGNRLIIIANIETRTPQVVADEDDVKNKITIFSKDYKIYPESDTLKVDILKYDSLDYERSWEEFKSSVTYGRLGFPKKLDLLFPLYKDLLLAKLLWELSFHDVEKVTGISYDLKQLHKKYDFKNARSNFRSLFDKFLKKLNFLASPPPTNRFMHSVRMTDPVGFKGKNRIVYIVENTDDKKYIWTERYNKSGVAKEMFLKNIKTSLSKNATII